VNLCWRLNCRVGAMPVFRINIYTEIDNLLVVKVLFMFILTTLWALISLNFYLFELYELHVVHLKKRQITPNVLSSVLSLALTPV